MGNRNWASVKKSNFSKKKPMDPNNIFTPFSGKCLGYVFSAVHFSHNSTNGDDAKAQTQKMLHFRCIKFCSFICIIGPVKFLTLKLINFRKIPI